MPIGHRKPYSPRANVIQPLDQSIRYIPLTQGQVAIVDAEDFEQLSQWNWCAWKSDPSQTFYARRTAALEKPSAVYMHRQIMNAGPGQELDHIDHNGLNNTKANLRFCTSRQNKGNIRVNNRHGYKGVTHDPKRKNQPWKAQIKINRRPVWLGRFRTIEEAARAYDQAAKNHFGEFATLNFPIR